MGRSSRAKLKPARRTPIGRAMAHPDAPPPLPELLSPRSATLPPAYASFEEAVNSVLEVLLATATMTRWAVFYEDRERDTQLTIATVGRRAPEVDAGDVLPWSDSLCRRLELGAPCIVPDTTVDPSYLDVPLVEDGHVAAYAACGIATGDGHVFGTLAGFSPRTQDVRLWEVEPILTLSARLLSTVLTQRRHAEGAGALIQALDRGALRDPLTGLGSRQRWDAALAEHEAHDRIGAVAVELDDLDAIAGRAGDAARERLVRRAAHAVLRSVRPDDVACRIADGAYAVLLPHCSAEDAVSVGERIRAALVAADISASVGSASRWRGEPLPRVLERAGRSMAAERALRDRRDQIDPFVPDASTVGHQRHARGPRRRSSDG
jgi:diguanylate cyclase (GGDEF)-like protein